MSLMAKKKAVEMPRSQRPEEYSFPRRRQFQRRIMTAEVPTYPRLLLQLLSLLQPHLCLRHHLLLPRRHPRACGNVPRAPLSIAIAPLAKPAELQEVAEAVQHQHQRLSHVLSRLPNQLHRHVPLLPPHLPPSRKHSEFSSHRAPGRDSKCASPPAVPTMTRFWWPSPTNGGGSTIPASASSPTLTLRSSAARLLLLLKIWLPAHHRLHMVVVVMAVDMEVIIAELTVEA